MKPPILWQSLAEFRALLWHFGNGTGIAFPRQPPSEFRAAANDDAITEES